MAILIDTSVLVDAERRGRSLDQGLWIAATALGHGMGLATANPRHFERVPGLDVVPV